MTDIDLAGIRQRDAAATVCAACGLVSGGQHDQSIEECDAQLRTALEKRGGTRAEVNGHLCWTPEDHHPFVPGPFPAYEDAKADRRVLLRLGSALLTEMHGTTGCDPNCETRYHAVFNGSLTDAEYREVVGPSLANEEWDAHIVATRKDPA